MIARDMQPLVGDRDAYVVTDVPGYRDDSGVEVGPRRIARRPAIRRVAEATREQDMIAWLVSQFDLEAEHPFVERVFIAGLVMLGVAIVTYQIVLALSRVTHIGVS